MNGFDSSNCSFSCGDNRLGTTVLDPNNRSSETKFFMQELWTFLTSRAN